MTEQDDFEKTRKALMRLDAVPDPDPLRRASARRAFLEQASRWRAGPAAGRLARSGRVPGWLRLAAAAACALGLALTSLTGVAFAADGARPGDLLYPLDRELERVQLIFSPDADQRAALLLAMADERLQEAEQLAAQGDEAHMADALQDYGQTISAISETIGDGHGPDLERLAARLNQTLSAQEQRLETIRQHLPEPAQPGLDRAIDAARQGHRNDPTPEPSGVVAPTDDEPGNGRPKKTPGPPEDRPHGPPEDNPHGPPDDRGRP